VKSPQRALSWPICGERSINTSPIQVDAVHECQTGGEKSQKFVASNRSPLDVSIGAERLERYEHALVSLKERERQAIMLRVEPGLDYQDMRSELGKPSADAARMAITRAITRLAAEMRRAH
jgi:DNA-directed RNA polymerase specialized sigma24 family protein